MNGQFSFPALRNTFIILLILFHIPIIVKGQAVIGVADYMKVVNVEEYLELEKQWYQIHKERLKEGMISGWAMYEVVFTSPEESYDFVTVSWYDSFSKMREAVSDETIQAAFPDMNANEIKEFHQKTEQARTRVSQEFFHQMLTSAEGLDTQGKFYRINEIKVQKGKSKDLLEIYEEIYLPLYKEDVKQQKRTVWSLWEKFEGTLKDYQYLSADGYSSMDQIDQVNYKAYFNKIHPNKDVEKISEEVEKLRELVSTEMWKLIMRVHK
jgi:hypothetical protein